MGWKLDLSLSPWTTVHMLMIQKGPTVMSAPEWNRHHLSVKSTRRSQANLFPSHKVCRGRTDNNKIQVFTTGDHCFLFLLTASVAFSKQWQWTMVNVLISTSLVSRHSWYNTRLNNGTSLIFNAPRGGNMVDRHEAGCTVNTAAEKTHTVEILLLSQKVFKTTFKCTV